MSTTMLSAAILILAIAQWTPVSGIVGHCSTNTFDSNTTWLQFTKEVTSTEYVVNEKFKSLHCCAKGYRSIEWYKDSRVYPWPAGVSSFILYPEAANQTVYTQQATETDGGNYTCVLRNDTHILVHTIILTSVEKPPPIPRATFTPSDKWVELGSHVRLYCEAFVGNVNLPDARNDISWKRVYPEGSKHETQLLSRDLVQREQRDDSQIIGAYYSINDVRSDDYGQYVCTVANGESTIDLPVWLYHYEPELALPDTTVPWRDLLLFMVILVLVLITLGVLYARFGTCVIVKCKNIGIIGAKNVTREYDVLALSTTAEAPNMDVMIQILSKNYGFKCTSHHVSNDSTNWYNDVSQLAKNSHSTVLLTAPENFTSPHFKETLAKIHTLIPETKPIIVCMQQLPKIQQEAKDANGLNLDILLKKSKLVLWRNLRDESFWLELQRVLPLPSQNGNLKTNSKSVNVVVEGNSNVDLNRITICNSPKQADGKESNIVKTNSGVMV